MDYNVKSIRLVWIMDGLDSQTKMLGYELTYRLCMMRVLIKKSSETAQKYHHIIKPCTQSAMPERKEHFLKNVIQSCQCEHGKED